MKTLKGIFESIVKGNATGKEINKKTDNAKDWIQYCRSFCLAGSWRFVNNKNVTPKIMQEDFIEDAKKFNIDSWKTSDTNKEYYYIPGYKLAMALLDKRPKNEILEIYTNVRYYGSNSYWFQDVSNRRDLTGYGFVIEALLIISLAIYKYNGNGLINDLWCYSDVSPYNFKTVLYVL